MPSSKDLQNRITTVKNTQQTTRAMKMVSAAKLRRAQEAIQNQRPYAKRLGELVQEMLGLTGGVINSPLVKQADATAEAGTRKKLLLVLVTSDRGLCGGFNGSVIKTAQRWIAANRTNYEQIELGFVGRKGYDFFKTKKVMMGPYYSELGGKVTFAKAKQLAAGLIEYYTSGKADEIKIIYNEFKNAASQIVRIDEYLPLGGLGDGEKKSADEAPMNYIVKPSPAEVLAQLLTKHFPIQAFRIMLDSQASEHGARMSAMENATKNAGEMIRKLTLQYNKQRQASITSQLLEIISGAESQKSSA